MEFLSMLSFYTQRLRLYCLTGCHTVKQIKSDKKKKADAIWITHHSLSCCTLVLTVLSAKTALAVEEAIAEYFSLVLCGVTLFCIRAEEQQGMNGRRIEENENTE